MAAVAAATSVTASAAAAPGQCESPAKRAKREEPDSKCLVGLVQMTAVNDKDANLAFCERQIQEAKERGCVMVFFPECFSFIGARPGEAQDAAEEVGGPTISRYRDIAAKHQMWLSLGGFQEKGPADDAAARIYNCHLVIDADGQVVASYRKIHLFDVPMTGLVESRQALPGDQLVSCDSPVGTLGVTICYDLRFPELYQKLTFLHGAKVLLVPSAFAMKTGEAHWETLLRSRAIENQCYVFAAAQVGQHNEDGNRRKSWGHSLAIDPWGQVLVDMGGDASDVGLAVVEVDSKLIESTRGNMPMAEHRRYDIYGGPPFAKARAGRAADDPTSKGLFFG